jgi:hypothetical protein
LPLWRTWAPRVTGQPIDSGHFLAEENPDATATALVDFFAAVVPSVSNDSKKTNGMQNELISTIGNLLLQETSVFQLNAKVNSFPRCVA